MSRLPHPAADLDDGERRLLAALADELIPAGEGFPSAAEAGVAGPGLDRVLSFRPDLAAGLKSILAGARGREPAAVIAELRRADPAAFDVLAELVPGAYFLDEGVRRKLGYAGQTPRDMAPSADIDEELLRPVSDRGAIYRPTPDLPRYEPLETYEWNYEHAPPPPAACEPRLPGEWRFCGLRVGSPLGIAAGPLLNGRWILYYAALGFDVLTYKTVRSGGRACYGLPNLQPVAAEALRGDGAVLDAAAEMRGSWAVSFGMPSREPDVWRLDVEATRRALPPGKVLSVSVVATPGPEWTREDLAADYARCARWAVEAGADCVEANFSCPNVASADGQVYQHPELAGLVAARVRAAIGRKPLLLKIGHITGEALAGELARAVAPYADALVMVNCVAAGVVDARRQPMFGAERRGIAGAAIQPAALEQVRLFARVLRRERCGLRLVGVGGISTSEHVRAHLEAGCEAVQVATAAMVDPRVGIKIREGMR